MGLAKYKKMRRFGETSEPAGKVKKSDGKKLEFVIQKHQASRLHYDFRLELDGVLKSWAVPKGPSLNPKDRRLAMMVEDHPYEYRKFEGVIPEGNYGAGNVIIWDRGWYEHDHQLDDKSQDLQEGLKNGELKFIMHGQKLKGSFALIKTRGMGDNAWLLIKHKDKYASEVDITEDSQSVVSGKNVEEIGQFDASGDTQLAAVQGASEDRKGSVQDGTLTANRSSQRSNVAKSMGGVDGFDIKQAPAVRMPRNVKPMLATLVAEPFDDPDWLFEIKWDGYRAIGAWDDKETQLYSRTGQDFSQRYAPVR